MIVAEINNPSDLMTIAHPDREVLQVAGLLLGRGAFGLTQVEPAILDGEDDTILPIMLFGLGDGYEEILKRVNDSKKAELADCMDSLLYCGARDRRVFADAVSGLSPEEALAYRIEYNDDRRSSLNDYCRVARAWADQLRKRETSP